VQHSRLARIETVRLLQMYVFTDSEIRIRAVMHAKRRHRRLLVGPKVVPGLNLAAPQTIAVTA